VLLGSIALTLFCFEHDCKADDVTNEQVKRAYRDDAKFHERVHKMRHNTMLVLRGFDLLGGG
jgi:hypothetical protein